MHIILSPGPSYTTVAGDKQRNNVYSVTLVLQILVLFSKVHYFIQWYIKPVMPYVRPSKFTCFSLPFLYLVFRIWSECLPEACCFPSHACLIAVVILRSVDL